MTGIFRPGRTACALLAIVSSTFAFSATAGSHSARSLVTQKIDNNNRITLAHNVRPELNAKTDLGPVEDTLPIARMFMVLNRTPENQAALRTLIERQHQVTAREFHKWLTPQQVGERFGSSQADIAKITDWLTSQGFTVKHVTHNNSIIDFSGTSRMVREAFHTQLHYVDYNGEKRIANAQDPQIPAALAPIVGGIVNLENIPAHANHTPIQHASYDKDTHQWHSIPAEGQAAAPRADFSAGSGYYLVTPQDFYTIYNENPLLNAGHTGANATIAVIEQTAIAYGTVNSTTGQATGGDVATFRSTFGVPGTLNMYVYYGYGSTTCTTPAIVGDEGEATLDAEWATAVAPSAKLIFMACANDNTLQGGIFASMTALIDNNLSDSMSLSYGSSELNFQASDYSFFDMLASTAATQGQSIFISSGDSGSDVADQDTSGTATSGINVSGFASGPYITSSGGTDFQDAFDSTQPGGAQQSTYWGATNSAYYADALSYVPETSWNDSCASSLIAAYFGMSPVAFCNSSTASSDGFVAGDVVAGSGGFSTNYAVPSYQSGITGYSGTMRAQPDIAMFAANGVWGHYLVFCDSTDGATCDNPSDFAGAGGTSFVAPQMAGLGGLLTDYTGSRQGVLNYGLYALAKAQFTNSATQTACYANGQTSNTGVTTGLPASGCIFNDVTTSNNDVPCQSGSLDCYAGGGAYGVLSTTTSSLNIAYNSGIGYDEATGIGSININNLLTQWNTAFNSTTTLTASPSSITSGQSTTLTATVVGGQPAGYTGQAPTLAGSVNFYNGANQIGDCTLASGTCSITVTGSTLGLGTDSVTATFVGSNAYPTSTSTTITVTVTNAPPTITANPSTVTIAAAGGSGTTTITISGFSGNPTLACSGLPVGVSCSFGAITGGTSTLTISTGSSSVTGTGGVAANSKRAGGNTPVVLAFCLPGFLALAGLAGVRRKTILSRTLFVLALSVGLAAGISGCGGSNHTAPYGSTVTVTATSGSQSASTTISLIVQ